MASKSLALSAGKSKDVELIPGDIVYVSKAWYASTSDVLNALSPILSTANAFAIFALDGAVAR